MFARIGMPAVNHGEKTQADGGECSTNAHDQLSGGLGTRFLRHAARTRVFAASLAQDLARNERGPAPPRVTLLATRSIADSSTGVPACRAAAKPTRLLSRSYAV